MSEVPLSTTSSLVFSIVSADISTVSYDDPIIESISVDENGNTVTVFYPDTYSGPIGKTDENVGSRVLDAPNIVKDFLSTTSENYFLSAGDGPYVSYLDVHWELVDYATGYQVFIIIDDSAAVLLDSIATTPLLNYKGLSPLFSDQSGILDAGTTNFRFDFKGSVLVNKLHALVFSYNIDLVGRYPVNMITCVPTIGKMFIEKTSYYVGDNRYFTTEDDSDNFAGPEINVSEQNILAI